MCIAWEGVLQDRHGSGMVPALQVRVKTSWLVRSGAHQMMTLQSKAPHETAKSFRRFQAVTWHACVNFPFDNLPLKWKVEGCKILLLVNMQ